MRISISKKDYRAVIFDLDGVVTRTAKVHAAAWKALFDDYLKQRTEAAGESFEPFDTDHDYRRYVDGKPRYEGVKSFLKARDIKLPYGDLHDPPDRETICGLGNRKNELYHERLATEGVETWPGALDLLHRLRDACFVTAVVSASKNCQDVLESAHIGNLFDIRVDGMTAEREGLAGKPAPDTFLEAARRLQLDPAQCIVLEDATAGVQAGHRGGFGKVIGVDRSGQAQALSNHGADAVVTDLFRIEIDQTEWLPSALDCLDRIANRADGKRIAVFLDYDGTLTPIVDRPEQALLTLAMHETLQRLAAQCSVAIISGRDLRDVRQLVSIDDIYYAGSHGFEIAGPLGQHYEHPRGVEALPALDAVETELRKALAPIDGALVDRKHFSLALHYRLTRPEAVPGIERAVDLAREAHPGLRKTLGKKIFELQPDADWDKGAAVNWLLKALDLDRPEILPVYIGDNETDEDAFRALVDQGIGIAVADPPRPTTAAYLLRNPDQVQQFLKALAARLERPTWKTGH